MSLRESGDVLGQHTKISLKCSLILRLHKTARNTFRKGDEAMRVEVLCAAHLCG